MSTNEIYMSRCLELARIGTGGVAPNPMVGCVIVYQDKIIGEGFHQKYGEAHAEVNAINSVKDPKLLQQCTLFVTLEPCAHQGITPPCSNLIVDKQIPRVVVGTIDPFSEVSGKGIEKMRKAGIKVDVGILENECRELNKRFFTFHEKKRPYIILKWAQTLDGYIDIERSSTNYGSPTWITGELALRLVHKIRSEEGAILVGRSTAEKDNPSLTVRHWAGKNPLRLVLDKNLTLQKNLNIFDGSEKTIVFNSKENSLEKNREYIRLDYSKNIIPQIVKEIYNHRILSLIIEGGRKLIESFIEADMWDEAHVFSGKKFFYKGIKSPGIPGSLVSYENLDNDFLYVFFNRS